MPRSAPECRCRARGRLGGGLLISARVKDILQPLELPPRDLRRREQLRLAVEILVAYVQLLRLVRRNDLPEMVAGARCVVLPETSASGDPHAAALRLASSVLRVLGVLPTDKRCLIRSLVLLRLLSQRSIDANVVIGVRSENGFEAHAWVEHAKRAVLPAGGYERLVEL